jgi:hypothetical protein
VITAAAIASALGVPPLLCLVAASAAWLVAVSVSADVSVRVVIVVAVVGRAALWSTGIATDDLHRYVWEGRVQALGLSPYALAPNDPRLAPLRDESFHRINHPDHAAIYPPLAQAVFRAAATLSLREDGFRLLFVLLDVLTVGVLVGWLRAARAPPGWALIYAWCPISALTAATGHYEPLALLPLAAAGWAWTSRRFTLASACLACAVMTKVFPILLLPWMLRRRFRATCLGFLPVVLVLALPHLGDDPIGPLAHFGRAFAFNGSLFRWLDTVSGGRGLLLAGLLLGGCAVTTAVRQPRFASAAALTLAALLLLSPTVHYWYLAWPLLPIAAAGPRRWNAPFLAWCVSVVSLWPVYARAHLGGPFEPIPAATLVEYAVPAVVALAVVLRHAWPRGRSALRGSIARGQGRALRRPLRG